MNILQKTALKLDEKWKHLNFGNWFLWVSFRSGLSQIFTRVSEWLLFCGQFSNFSAISWREKVNFQWDDDEVCPVLDQLLSWIYIVLAHWNNSPQADMLLHSDTLFWFRANQSLLFLLKVNAACLAEKQQIPILSSLAWPDQISNPWSTTLEASMLHITTSMRFHKREDNDLSIT